MFYIILVIVAIVSFLIGRKSVTSTTPESLKPKYKEELVQMRKESREALTERTKNRKNKILYLLNITDANSEELKACGITDNKNGITSENIERFFDISNATARKYLNELEDEGKIKQIGTTGPDVYYTLIQ